MILSGAIFDVTKIIGQLLVDIIYFPFWWYSRGLLKVLSWSKKYLHTRLEASGLLIWLKNIFVPMYGQSDWAGILISFFTRVVQIIARTLIMFFWLLVVVTLIGLWLITPILVVYQLNFQIQSFFSR